MITNRRRPHQATLKRNLKRNNYGGPCPPSGVHRYYFRLFALDTSLELPAKSKRKVIDTAVQGHIIDEATLMGRYARRGY
jgi:Raf kinase inhibitor-like YbhB/YbcL family protein